MARLGSGMESLGSLGESSGGKSLGGLDASMEAEPAGFDEGVGGGGGGDDIPSEVDPEIYNPSSELFDPFAFAKLIARMVYKMTMNTDQNAVASREEVGGTPAPNPGPKGAPKKGLSGLNEQAGLTVLLG